MHHLMVNRMVIVSKCLLSSLRFIGLKWELCERNCLPWVIGLIYNWKSFKNKFPCVSDIVSNKKWELTFKNLLSALTLDYRCGWVWRDKVLCQERTEVCSLQVEQSSFLPSYLSLCLYWWPFVLHLNTVIRKKQGHTIVLINSWSFICLWVHFWRCHLKPHWI